MDTKRNSTQSVQRALMILSAFSDAAPERRVSDIARELGLTTSIVSRLLGTMMELGFVERNESNGFYRLGIQIITLSGTALHSHELYRHAYPEMQRLSVETNLHIFLGIRDHQDLVHLAGVGGDETNDLFTPPGYHRPLFCCAMGKAIMAQLSDQEVDDILSRGPLRQLTPYTVTDPETIKKNLETVRSKGYAVIENELSVGKASLAAPIFDRKRNIAGAISVIGNINVINLKENEAMLAQKVLSTTTKISGKLGYFPR